MKRTGIAVALLSAGLLAAMPVAAAEFVLPARMLAPGQVDYYDIVLDDSGFVALATFELGTDADTIVSLFESVSGLLAQHDNVDVANGDLSSSIVRSLAAGSYTAAVSGFPNFYPFESVNSVPGEYTLVVFGETVVSASFASSVIVPVPAPVWLLAAGALALGRCSRRATP